MSVKRPDIYEHNNPDLAFVDSDSVRGGRRIVQSLDNLFALVSKVDQLKEGVTIVRVRNVNGNSIDYLLKDITKVGLIEGWEPVTAVSHWLDIEGKPTINEVPADEFGNYTITVPPPIIIQEPVGVSWVVKPLVSYTENAETGQVDVHLTKTGRANWSGTTVYYNVNPDGTPKLIGSFDLTEGEFKRIDVIVATQDGALTLRTGPESETTLVQAEVLNTELFLTFFIVSSTAYIQSTTALTALTERVRVLETQDWTGEKGEDGEDGYTPVKGTDYFDGEKGDTGDTGAEGLSAYQVWLAVGNTGTEADYLLFLKGEKGDKGDTAQALLDYEIIVKGTNQAVLPNGTVLPAEMPLTDLWKKILVKETFPTYLAPAASLTSTQTGTVERGTRVTPTLTPIFAQNDAGELNSYVLLRNAAVLASDNVKPVEYAAFTDGYTIGVETLLYKATFNYDQGIQKVGDEGTNAPGRIAAGSLSIERSIVGVLPWFYGSNTTGDVPTVYSGSKVIASILNEIAVPSFGTGIKFLWFAVPAGTKVMTKWFRTALDTGAIGGSTNLFKSRTSVNVTSTGLTANWTEPYDLYISNYATDADIPTTLS